MKRIFLLSLLLFPIIVTFGQDGNLDETFGSDGKWIYTLPDSDLKINDAIKISDKQVIAVGRVKYVSSPYTEIFVKIFNVDGTSSGGLDIENFILENVDHEAMSVGVQKDGKIVIAGNIYDNGLYKFFVCRLNTNGQLDPTFLDGGYKIFQISISQFANDLIIDKDDNIYVGGRVYTGLNSDVFLLKMLKNGAPDPDFGDGGLSVQDFGNGNEYIYTMELLADGSLLLAGDGQSNGTSAFLVCKLTALGEVDQTFGNNGSTLFLVGDGNNSTEDMAIQKDGKIFLTGYAFLNNKNAVASCRFNENGTIDKSFGQNGSLQQLFGTNEDYGTACIIQKDNKLIIGANISTNSLFDFGVFRLENDGVLDNTFGKNGITKTNFNNSSDELAKLLMIEDNRILAVGSQSVNKKSAVLLSKYIIKNSTSTSDQEVVDQISAFPNPFSDQIYLSQRTASNVIHIYSMDGRTYQCDVNVDGVINTHHIPSGSYFIKPDADHLAKPFKIVKY